MNTSLKKMVLISLLSALGFLIMLIAFPIPLFPVFLTMDFSDLPALIGAIILGPGAGIAIEAIKNILHVLLTGSLTVVPVGEFANFAAGTIFILVTWGFYRRKRTALSLLFGMITATLTMTVIMAVINYYFIFPSYALFLGYSIDAMVGMSQSANRSIHSLLTLIVYGVMPFNLLKGAALTLIMIPVSARLKRFIDKRIAA
ncbi:ECF transporter S component [Sporolactobacillus terrae]|uniref:Riboflavin transporter n=1 Tax=Sporolactobacillus terrae TaxID=269673 RepID=A0A410D7M5_9BACL|nr:ECF transporter S component [Sporolactobacillus terrae]QAA22123.1 ECF transporter S component [Sporolactobacillus terrae]QAA25095.1 ECF transporter S component [Sporolactobacillus terrae]UAK16916.1 ECF transporter S component [Sporolactobacillus terrae]BBN98422.1 riboflavin transporter [Sporolactobacillus terrae]